MNAAERRQLLETGSSHTKGGIVGMEHSKNMIARREWKCSDCGEKIPAGSPMNRWQHGEEDGWHIDHWCWDCAEANDFTEEFSMRF